MRIPTQPALGNCYHLVNYRYWAAMQTVKQHKHNMEVLSIYGMLSTVHTAAFHAVHARRYGSNK